MQDCYFLLIQCHKLNSFIFMESSDFVQIPSGPICRVSLIEELVICSLWVNGEINKNMANALKETKQFIYADQDNHMSFIIR